MTKTKKITTSAIMIALSAVLVFISKLIPGMPFGGSVTLASAVPIITISLMFGIKWGILSGIAFAIIQMLSGFYPPPAQSFLDFLIVIMLDYIIAFGVYGIAVYFYRLFRKKMWAIPVSGAIVMTLRYICHILSGILIWGVYAKEEQTVLEYSIVYNGSFMIPEIIITTIVLAILSRFLKKLF